MGLICVRKKEGTKAREMVLICDHCSKEFTREFSNRDFKRTEFFCSYFCFKEFRILNIERYELSQSAKKLEIRKKTILEKYGVENVFNVKEFRDKADKTILEIYGSKNPLQSKKLKDKQNKTIFERYGVSNISFLTEVQEKKKQTTLLNHGVEYPTQSFEIREKIKQTNLKNYGVEYPSQKEEVRAIAFETMKKNGNYGTFSKSELLFLESLRSYFGIEDIEHPSRANNHEIDFRIKSLNIYIQFDGRYWHGLDRTIEEIKKFKTKRDKTILSTIERDKKQNQWFKENNLRLIRITDKEFKDRGDSIIEDKIIKKELK